MTKPYLRLAVAYIAHANVAVTQHVARRQPLPRQRVIYNPVDCTFFGRSSAEETAKRLHAADSTFAYVGRLVSEKGVVLNLGINTNRSAL